MTNRWNRQHLTRVGALVIISTIGLVFTLVFLTDLLVTNEQPLEEIESGYALLFSVPLAASSEWLRRQPFTGDDMLYIVGWMVGGIVPIAFVTWLVLLDRTAFTLLSTVGDIAHIAVIGAVGGLVIGVVMVRKQKTTDHLRDTRSHLESVLDASPLPIVAVDGDGKLTRWNPAAERTFGWSENEVLGEPLSAVSENADFENLLEQFRTRGDIDGIEEQRRTKFGHQLDVRTYFSPIYDGDEVTGGMAIVQDITEEKRREAELLRSRELLTWTEEMANVGGWEWDPKSDTVQWTNGTKRIHGVDDDFVPDLDSALDFYPPGHREALESLVERTLETGEPYATEYRLVTATGKERWVKVRGERFERDDGSKYLRGAIRDISERKEHEQRLMVLNRVLRHNLRNDLNIIHGRAEMLHDDLASIGIPDALQQSTDQQELDTILSELATTNEELEARIAQFLDEVLRLEEFPIARAQGDAQTIVRKSSELASLGEKARQVDQLISNGTQTLEIVQIQPVLETVADRYRSRYPHASITVDCESNFQIQGRENQIEIAVEELVENAIKHSDEAYAEVTVSATRGSNQRIEICVADSGPGLPRTELETLRRGEETPLMHGNGLGLWLVNWSVSRMGGSVSVEANASSGTAVTICLPEHTESAQLGAL